MVEQASLLVMSLHIYSSSAAAHHFQLLGTGREKGREMQEGDTAGCLDATIKPLVVEGERA